jgi:hypothetical protein
MRSAWGGFCGKQFSHGYTKLIDVDIQTIRSLYTVSFLLNTILVANLERFQQLPKQIQFSQLPEFGVDIPFDASTTGYQAQNSGEDPEAMGSYSRSTGREREGIEM